MFARCLVYVEDVVDFSRHATSWATASSPPHAVGNLRLKLGFGLGYVKDEVEGGVCGA
jgi:hypothetical protein